MYKISSLPSHNGYIKFITSDISLQLCRHSAKQGSKERKFHGKSSDQPMFSRLCSCKQRLTQVGCELLYLSFQTEKCSRRSSDIGLCHMVNPVLIILLRVCAADDIFPRRQSSVVCSLAGVDGMAGTEIAFPAARQTNNCGGGRQKAKPVVLPIAKEPGCKNRDCGNKITLLIFCGGLRGDA